MEIIILKSHIGELYLPAHATAQLGKARFKGYFPRFRHIIPLGCKKAWKIKNIMQIFFGSKSIGLKLSKTCPIIALGRLENFLRLFKIQSDQKIKFYL